MGFLDWEDKLVFYGSYHHHPINKLIHILIVPIFTWTILVWLHLSGPLFGWPLEHIVPMDMSTLVVLSYIGYYLLLDPFAATLHAPFFIRLLTHSKHYFDTNFNNWTLFYILVLCLIGLNIGHGVFENRAPAILDDLFFVLVLSPFIVFYEVMFMLGYRPQFYERLNQKIEESIQIWKNKKKRN